MTQKMRKMQLQKKIEKLNRKLKYGKTNIMTLLKFQLKWRQK